MILNIVLPIVGFLWFQSIVFVHIIPIEKILLVSFRMKINAVTITLYVIRYNTKVFTSEERERGK